MDFKNIPKKYRPVPFWSWNEKLNTVETAEQVHKMNDAGMGGFFMHARGGLQTPYMGEEWFENVTAAVNSASECDMRPWAYDENGWPSGFGDGAVNEIGIEFQQKYLRMTDVQPSENVICKSGSHWFYFDINPFYVDTLDKNAVRKFIETAYAPYYEKYGNRIEGFFTDEPQISRDGIPWSFVFKEEYQRRYNEDIYTHLEELFLPIGDFKNTRVNFWKMVTELFSESYFKQIYDWCSERGLKLTGHLALEEQLSDQLTPNGACMPHYEYFHIPGMDWLCRNINESLTTMQLSSVAEQLGKEAVLSESFAVCGHGVSFAELKGIYEWQMVHGINLLCQHLEGYSIRGIRKRDYPPAMYYQQPWWNEYGKFIDALSRQGMILNKSQKFADVLVIHPQTTAWSLYDSNDNKGLKELEQQILGTMKQLEQKHIMYHLGDEIIMERHAKVRDGKLIIGRQSYSIIIKSCCDILLPNTKRLLSEFEKSGGRIVTADELAENPVIDDKDIFYTRRNLDGTDIHYFVNTSNKRKTAHINVKGKKLDIYTSDLLDFNSSYEFEPWGSLMVTDNGFEIENIESTEVTLIHPKDEFRLTKPVCNAMTLDRCDYYFDGELQEKNGYVLNICEKANALERAVKIHQDYHVTVKHIPKRLEMACETPEIFRISINGKRIETNISGYFRDKSFKTIDITEYVSVGENTISFDCDFKQSDEVYENLKKAKVFESEKNKLSYDMEIESIYLLGNFGVKTDGIWEKLDKNAVRYCGGFEIDRQSEKINIKNIEQQGFPFFCGEMELEGKINITGENPVLELDIKGVNAVRVAIGDIEKTMLTDNRLSLSDFGISGKTSVKFTLVNNLRNLLGPHHLKCGESYAVGPSVFYKEPCVWNENPEPDWDDNYCFVETGI